MNVAGERRTFPDFEGIEKIMCLFNSGIIKEDSKNKNTLLWIKIYIISQSISIPTIEVQE